MRRATALAVVAALALSSACATTSPAPNPPPSAVNVAAAILALPRPSTTSWDAQVKALLLADFDADDSGALDGPETLVIPCDVLRAMTSSVARGTGGTFAGIYGVEQGLMRWTGGLLGFVKEARDTLRERLEGCGGAPPPDGKADVSPVADDIRNLEPAGGADAWDDKVRDLLVDAFDADRSGRIDTESEVDAVPCAVWVALHEAVQSGSDVPLLALYGFAEGYGWVGGALGFEEGMRKAAWTAATECGLPSD